MPQLVTRYILQTIFEFSTINVRTITFQLLFYVQIIYIILKRSTNK